MNIVSIELDSTENVIAGQTVLEIDGVGKGVVAEVKSRYMVLVNITEPVAAKPVRKNRRKFTPSRYD